MPLAPAAEGGLDGEVAYAARDSVRIVLAPRAGRPDGAPPPDDTVTLFAPARFSILQMDPTLPIP